jgi:diguanylate cyclase (GGDEF)-like protein
LSEAQRVASLGNWYWELDNASVHWSDEMRRIVDGGRGTKSASLRRFLAAVDGRERAAVIAELRALLGSPRGFSGEHRVVGADGSERFVFHQGASEANAQGRVFRIHGTIQDITERKQVEQQIRRLALYDSLTGLPNRQFFKESLDHAIARATRGKENLAVLFIDLDRFKRINDTLGHATGDLLLQEAARRLRQCVRLSDFVAREVELPQSVIARLGGDEFTVSLVDLKHPQDAAKVAGRILHEMEKPFLVGGQELNVTASIGIAIFPDNGQDAETLLKNADVAMYQAKAAGKNVYKFFAEEMNAAALEKLTLENELKHALERDQFVLYYQPKIDIQSGAIVGVEALIRWRHPQRGLLLPGVFIGMAEEMGMIVPIGRWVLQTACRQVTAWRQMNLPEISVAVNLASPSFHDALLAKEVSTVLGDFRLRPNLLELEATESMLMRDVGATLRTLSQLRELGVKLSIDDFGTGHSSLSYLRRFRIDQLKIDRSFVAEITDNPDDAAITAAIISLGRSLDIEVVAEGVETAAQARLLRAQGCRLLQGYFFGKPVSAEALAQLLNTKLASATL